MSQEPTYFIEFRDNHLLSQLVGPQDRYINRIEQRLGVSLSMRGNRVGISGTEPECTHARNVLQYLYKLLAKGREIDMTEVDTALRMVSTDHVDDAGSEKDDHQISITTKRRLVFPRSQTQTTYIESIQTRDMTFGIGPAGTGKTYLAVAAAVSMLTAGQIDKIILTRPAVEAGERLGFLPGDMKEKVDPYLRPLYDALNDMLPPDQIIKKFAAGEIEVAPLAFMRGRTLSNAFVILDEAQNTTTVQMKMFLTRLGNNSRMVITGDLTQIDLPPGIPSGLRDAVHILKDVPEIGIITFNADDVVRHALVSKIVVAYEKATAPRV